MIDFLLQSNLVENIDSNYRYMTNGLFEGKAGCAGILYFGSSLFKDSQMSDLADNIILDICSNISELKNLTFDTGIIGVGWMINQLILRDYIEIEDTEIFFRAIDNAILDMPINNGNSLFDGNIGAMLYLNGRLKNEISNSLRLQIYSKFFKIIQALKNEYANEIQSFGLNNYNEFKNYFIWDSHALRLTFLENMSYSVKLLQRLIDNDYLVDICKELIEKQLHVIKVSLDHLLSDDFIGSYLEMTTEDTFHLRNTILKLCYDNIEILNTCFSKGKLKNIERVIPDLYSTGLEPSNKIYSIIRNTIILNKLANKGQVFRKQIDVYDSFIDSCLRRKIEQSDALMSSRKIDHMNTIGVGLTGIAGMNLLKFYANEKYSQTPFSEVYGIFS